jgi:hypothetical protein
MTDSQQGLYSVDILLEAAIFSSSFPDSKELVQRLKTWASKNKFVLVATKSDKKKVHLRCKLGQRCQIKINESERKRSKTSIRQECPFLLKISKSVDGICVLKPQDSSKNEDQHNHDLSVEEFQLIAEGRRSAISDKAAETISTMLDAGNSIPEISKTLGGRKAVTIMSYMDLYNWRQEVERTGGDAFESRSDALELLKIIESRGYLVSAMINKENKLDCIFFIHPKSLEEIKRRGEILIIDATYKVNNLDMSLISVQSVSNLGGEQLSTVPIAYSIAARETTEVYTWFLQTLKDRAYNQEGALCRTPVIVSVLL